MVTTVSRTVDNLTLAQHPHEKMLLRPLLETQTDLRSFAIPRRRIAGQGKR
jgi:hypothetical protein